MSSIGQFNVKYYRKEKKNQYDKYNTEWKITQDLLFDRLTNDKKDNEG